jgi:cGMP-dependent protein kinase
MGSCTNKSLENRSSIIKLSKSNQILPTSDDRRDFVAGLLSPRNKRPKYKSSKSYTPSSQNYPKEAASAQILKQVKSVKETEFIQNFFNKHFLFLSLSENLKSYIIDSMFLYKLSQDELVFVQGQPGQSFFIVFEGKLEVLVNDLQVNIIDQGQGFGELALIHDCGRSATVRTLTQVKMWGIDKNDFQRILENGYRRNFLDNLEFVRNIKVFMGIEERKLEKFVASLNVVDFEPEKVIIKQKDFGDLLYIVKQGSVSCIRGGYEIKRFNPGDYFGEQALIYNSPRTATCVAVGQVQCLTIDLASLQQTLGSQLQMIMFHNTLSIIMSQDPYLTNLIDFQINNLISSLQISKHQSGAIVQKKNSLISEKILIVLKGRLSCSGNNFETLSVLGLKESIFNLKSVFVKDLICEEDCEIASITYPTLCKSIGGDFQAITQINQAFKALSKVHIFKNLRNETLFSLINILKVYQYGPGQVIVQEGSLGDSLYIVKSGSVQVNISTTHKRIIQKNDYFGERSILFSQNRTATIVAVENTECWVLNSEDFNSIIDQNLKNMLIKRIQLQDDNLVLEDLLIIKLIGKGTHRNVFLAVHKVKKVLFAVRTFTKKRIHAYKLEESLKREKNILGLVDHEFAMKLVTTLKDSKRVYFVCEFVKGMDLYDVMRKMSVVSENDSKFFVSCLLVILEFIHEKDIVFRDLKPENIIIDEDGYLKLIDFSSSKITASRTYTIIGTPHYVAPEMILRKGYSISVDYWSLGVILYELLYEQVPFGYEEVDPLNIYSSILQSKLSFPNQSQFSGESKSFIKLLLNKDPSARLSRGFNDFKNHSWFRTIDWHDIINKKAKPAFVPNILNINTERVIQNFSFKQWDSIINKEENEDQSLPNTPSNLRWDIDF